MDLRAKYESMTVIQLRRAHQRVYGTKGANDAVKADLVRALLTGVPLRAEIAVIRGGHGKPGDAGKYDRRIPPSGSTIVKHYQERTLSIRIEDDESGMPWLIFQGERYRSPSAVSRAIVGTAINGYQFLGLTKLVRPAGKRAAAKRSRVVRAKRAAKRVRRRG